MDEIRTDPIIPRERAATLANKPAYGQAAACSGGAKRKPTRKKVFRFGLGDMSIVELVGQFELSP